MKHVKKGFAALLILGVIGLSGSLSADACKVTSGCREEGTTMVCGIPTIVPTAHIVPDGKGGSDYCYVFIMRSQHSYECDGCKATVSTDADMKTCCETHTYSGCVGYDHR